MESYLERLKEDLEETAEWQETVTVRRDDLERLIKIYEHLKRERAEWRKLNG